MMQTNAKQVTDPASYAGGSTIGEGWQLTIFGKFPRTPNEIATILVPMKTFFLKIMIPILKFVSLDLGVARFQTHRYMK